MTKNLARTVFEPTEPSKTVSSVLAIMPRDHKHNKNEKMTNGFKSVINATKEKMMDFNFKKSVFICTQNCYRKVYTRQQRIIICQKNYMIVLVWKGGDRNLRLVPLKTTITGCIR